MKGYRKYCRLVAVVAAAVVHSSCTLLPTVPFPWMSFSFSTPIGIQHFNIGIRGILGSSKLKSVVIDSVREGSAASEAGIVSGDELLSIDGVKISSLSFDEFKALFATFERALPGSRIAFEVIAAGAATSRIAMVVIPTAMPSKPRDLAAHGFQIDAEKHDRSLLQIE
jgi:predicted metalloprotease with PDZ domain